ncbi:beta-1,3-galactosyltransferase brn-like [Pecten maximus]|uniref:beta-1,3-galactosyltransferase brn-like n=1 Tax=Pecten maximus TaxID=6579 RepID=UPI001458FFFE|nr:beta-1,3-galactosyltransferase brn-like [Pecten maximus]XP_033738883.1 beta-1,3-galactosyltransferase brn-like [Pecten maximus]
MRFRHVRYWRVLVILFVVYLFYIRFTAEENRRNIYCLNFLQEHSIRKLLPFRLFHYPLDIDFKKLEEDITNKGTADVDPINEFPFSYKKPIENICDSTENIFLLFMVKSAPGNFDQRQVIRETWANKLYFEYDIIRHVFLLAKTMNETIYDRLSHEEEMHHDILEMTYVDDYYHSAYKTTGGINWCVKYCPTAKFVMLADDDLYVATDHILDYLHGLPHEIYRSLFVGKVGFPEPQRCPEDKWFMSIGNYSFEKYPNFVSGGAVIMSMDFAKRLKIAIPFTKQFKFDDVFLAIVAYKLGVKPINHSGIHISPAVSCNDDKFETALVSHGYENPNKLRAAWAFHIHPHTTNCSILSQN